MEQSSNGGKSGVNAQESSDTATRPESTKNNTDVTGELYVGNEYVGRANSDIPISGNSMNTPTSSSKRSTVSPTGVRSPIWFYLVLMTSPVLQVITVFKTQF